MDILIVGEIGVKWTRADALKEFLKNISVFSFFSVLYMTGQSAQEAKFLNDEKIITAIKKRSEATINEIITKYSKLLWSVAEAVLSHVGSVQDVEECVADTFIYLWEHPEKFDHQRGKLKTWLSIIARTQAVNRYREITKRNILPLEDTDFVDQLDVADAVLEVETRQALIAAVNALCEPDREILIRRYYYDQKPKEIALALDMSVKQIDNRLYQTKRRLREMLTRSGGGQYEFFQ